MDSFQAFNPWHGLAQDLQDPALRPGALSRLALVCETWASGPPTLAGVIARSSELFSDPAESNVVLQSRRLSVAAAFIDAGLQMVDIATRVRALLAHYDSDEPQQSPLDMPSLATFTDRVARGFTPVDLSSLALFDSIGYALGAQVLAVQALEVALANLPQDPEAVPPPHPPRSWNMPDAVALSVELCSVLPAEHSSLHIGRGLESAWSDMTQCWPSFSSQLTASS